MKTRTNLFTWAWLIPALLVFSISLFTACSKNENKTTTTMYNISGKATASQMVPAVSDTGTANITGTYNGSTRQLNYTTNWTNLTSGPTFGGFYYGATGVNGTIVGSPWELPSGTTGTGTFTGTVTLTSDQAAQLLAGNWYYVLGTTTHSTGEVRGQIIATPQ